MIAKKIKLFYALIGVVLVAFGRASWIWPLAPICAVCGYAFLWKASSRLLSLWTLFSIANLIHLSWLLSHPFLYIIGGWVALSLLFALPYALISQRVIATPLSFSRALRYAALFSLVEWSFTQLPCGFSFQTAALHLSWNPFSLQTASIFGAIGLSFVVFLTNLFFYAWMEHSNFGRYALFVALFPYLIGGSLYFYRSASPSPQLRVAVLHTEEPPDVEASHLSPYELHEHKWKQLFTLTNLLKNKDLDLILFPEAVVPYPAQSQLLHSSFLPQDLSYEGEPKLLSSLEIARLMARSYNAPILIGLENQGIGGSTNSCFFVPPEKREERYDKQLLLPFGEYIPFPSLRSFLADYGVHGSFFPGKETKLLDCHNLRLAPLICYEETFSTYTERAARLNPTCFVSIHNDAWFPDSRLRIEHFEQARLRAVETGKPIIRSCNKGVSGAINALGETIEHKEERGCFTIHLSTYSPLSLFLLIGGNSIALLLMCLALLSIFVEEKKSAPLTARLVE